MDGQARLSRTGTEREQQREASGARLQRKEEMIRRKSNRRGIVLLIVLSMLVLFSLLITTFVVVSADYRTAAVMSARGQAKKRTPRKLLDNTLFSLLVDTNDHQSPLRGHGLLRDMYGDDGFVARVANVARLDSTRGQFFEIQLFDSTGNNPQQVPLDLSGRVYALSETQAHYNGLVLTFVEGQAQGISTRIISYIPHGWADDRNLFRLMVIDPSTRFDPQLLQQGDRVVVNGRPFSGTGFGYNPLTSLLDAPDPGFDGRFNGGFGFDGTWGLGDDSEMSATSFIRDHGGITALLPNRSLHVAVNDSLPLNQRGGGSALANYLRGGADERYDAADFQNLHLAALIPRYNHRLSVQQGSYNPIELNSHRVLPSFHRPLLINWMLRNLIFDRLGARIGRDPTEPELLDVFLRPYGPDNLRNTGDETSLITDATQRTEFLDYLVNLKQMVIFRPLPELNPNFTGSNPWFTPEYFRTAVDGGMLAANPYLRGPGNVDNPWDVDNDGDGEPDGIWMDVGLPVEEDAKGRMFKGLVSILCVDLDGRLNLNAHGSEGHLNAARVHQDPKPVTVPANLAGNASPDALVLGRGEGPADVYLLPLFNLLGRSTNYFDQQQWDHYGRLFMGAQPGGALMPGRYGFDIDPRLNPRRQFPGHQFPEFELLSARKLFEYPANYFNSSSPLSAFQTPPDLWGEIKVGLDHRGQPSFSKPNMNRLLNQNHPYETNLLKPVYGADFRSGNADDTLFTVAELERLLRFHDPDAALLPPRLARMFGNDNGDNLFTNSDFAPLARQSVTTHSFDLPVPNMLEPRDLVDQFFERTNATIGPRSPEFRLLYSVLKPRANTVGLVAPGFSQNEEHRMHHVTDLLRARLIQGFGWGDPTSQNSLNVLRTWNHSHEHRLSEQMQGPHQWLTQIGLLSPDLAMGLRMDINRPFGNGRDDNNNQVVDEHGIWGVRADGTRVQAVLEEVMEPLWDGVSRFDHDNDGNVRDNDATLARQHYARHLYLLAMMLKDSRFQVREDLNGDRIVDDRDTARAIAQWAINVVDFRDADSIMTPFEFDSRPFTPHPGRDLKWGRANHDDDGVNGTDDVGEAAWPGTDDLPAWSVDGILADEQGRRNEDTVLVDHHTDVVWGCERPELLITETLAFHDRRTEDLANTNREVDYEDEEGRLVGEDDAQGDPNSDSNDFDQRSRPKGSLFVELYNPWASTAEVELNRVPAELYQTTTRNRAGVMLHRVNEQGSPVWRMTITTADEDSELFPELPDPDDPRAKVTTERVIYFTNTSLAGRPLPRQRVRPGSATLAFEHDTDVGSIVGLAPVLPGRYAVVGTCEETAPGNGRARRQDLEDPDTGSRTPSFYRTVGDRSSSLAIDDIRRVVMHADPDPDSNWVYVLDDPMPSGVVPRRNTNMMPTVAIPIPGMSISEGRMDADFGRITGSREGGFTWSRNRYPPLNGALTYNPPRDRPFDVPPDVGQRFVGMDPYPHVWMQDVRENLSTPKRTISDNKTYEAVRYVHLQRLANPLLPHDPDFNPYLTIDTAPIDLTVFNGLEDDRSDDPADPARDRSVRGGRYVFDSRERGLDRKTLAAPRRSRNLWSNRTSGPELPSPTETSVSRARLSDHLFSEALTHSLGYLNRTYGDRIVSGSGADTYIGAPVTTVQDPPFPWLTWLNRPYTSQYDLLLVPAVRSSQLLSKFSLAEPSDGSATRTQMESVYLPESEASEDRRRRQDFQHLMNFFSVSQPRRFVALDQAGTVSRKDAGGTTKPGISSNLAFILDFTHVPSKFVGTETWLDFRDFNNTTNAGTEHLHPPFNRVSAYREPGKINLNTVYNHVVMDALRGGNRTAPALPLPSTVTAGVGPQYWQIADSRRGIGGLNLSGVAFPRLAPGYDPLLDWAPTMFTNPFRGFGDSTLVTERWIRSPTESTLLRSDRINQYLVRQRGTLPNIPSWPESQAGPSNPASPLFANNRPAVGAGTRHVDPERNAYFKHEPLARMGNLVTTRSNVYAIWITIGFFEVEQTPPQRLANTGAVAGHLNRFGYRLGRELGWDTGEIRRHRAFYVIDRSIPVAFEPGKAHNAANAIMLRRFIE